MKATHCLVVLSVFVSGDLGCGGQPPVQSN